MPKTKSSKHWLKEHFDDDYVARARREGYRSRAVYKLMELDERYQLFSPGMTVVDLGAAPGSWSQYVAERVGAQGRVVACDLLAVDSIPGVHFVRGDFTQSSILEEILSVLQGTQVDIVISDMAPNMSGVSAVDQPRSLHLLELALELAQAVLGQRGALLMKAFQGEGFGPFVQQMRTAYRQVYIRKPKASRDRSREVYLLARVPKLV